MRVRVRVRVRVRKNEEECVGDVLNRSIAPLFPRTILLPTGQHHVHCVGVSCVV